MRVGYLAATLSCLYVLFWSLEPSLFGPAEPIFPLIRWALAIGMSLTVTLTKVRVWLRGIAIIVFVVTLALSLAVDPNASASFPIFARIASAAALALFAGSLPSERRLTVIHAILGTSAALVLGSVIFGVVSPSMAYKLIGSDRLRLYGVTPHPGTLGYLSALAGGAFLVLGLLPGTKRKGSRRLRDILFGVAGVVALIWADSRTGQIAVIMSVVVSAFMFLLVRTSALRISLVGPWLMFAGATIIAVSIPILIASGSVDVEASSTGTYAGSTMGRIEIWQAGLQEFWRNPYLGAGLASTFRTSTMAINADPLFYFHSVLINYLAKAGVLGGVSTLMLLVVVPWNLLLAARRVTVSTKDVLASWQILQFATVGFVVTLVFSVTEAALQNIYPTFLIFFISALLPLRGAD